MRLRATPNATAIPMISIETSVAHCPGTGPCRHPYGNGPQLPPVPVNAGKIASFADAFERYLAPDGQEEASKPQHRNNADEMGTSTTSATATAAPLLRFENAKKPNNDGQCCGVAVANPGEAHRAHLETRCDQCGQPATSADPLHPWDWPGRPDGITLHSSCEVPWFDSEGRQ
jgi:hypothetical protein